jgi:hypothetical protein
MFFDSMLSGRRQPEQDGSYFIDRSAEVFGIILDFLQGEEIRFANLSKRQLDKLEIEANVYLLAPLLDLLPVRFDSSVMGEVRLDEDLTRATVEVKDVNEQSFDHLIIARLAFVRFQSVPNSRFRK